MLFAQLWMGRICAEFCAAYPDITFDVVAEDRVVDLVEEQFDVAIRPNPRPDTGLVGRCFATDQLVVVAAPSVAPPAAAPQPAPLPAIVMSNFAAGPWALDDGRVLAPVPKLRLSSFLTIRDAAAAGAGAAALPRSIAWELLARGDLVQWGTVAGSEVALWVLHTSRRLPAPKVRAFVEFMAARYPQGRLAVQG